MPYVWVSSVSSCDLLPCPFSDHCTVLLSVSVPDAVPPGHGLWKLNTSILKDEYIKIISDFWSEWRTHTHRFPSLPKWWVVGKRRIKGLTIRYCCLRSVAQSRNRDLLAWLVSHLKERVDAGSASCLEPYHSALTELAALDLRLAKGVQVRSRNRWIEKGEISSAYFFQLQKKCSTDPWISALRESDGSIISPPDLRRCFSSFYSSLFIAAPTDPSVQSSLLDNIVSPSIAIRLPFVKAPSLLRNASLLSKG